MGTMKSLLRAATGELAYPRCVAEFDDYRAAQDAVSRLVRAGVPAEEVAVVGRDLRSMQRVLPPGSLALRARMGAVLGVWCGLLFALPFLLAADPRGFTFPITSALIGALVGLGWGAAEQVLARRSGNLGFATGPIQVLAERYEVHVEHRHAEQARGVLGTPLIPRPLTFVS